MNRRQWSDSRRARISPAKYKLFKRAEALSYRFLRRSIPLHQRRRGEKPLSFPIRETFDSPASAARGINLKRSIEVFFGSGPSKLIEFINSILVVVSMYINNSCRGGGRAAECVVIND
jgi:hypothetical protein